MRHLTLRRRIRISGKYWICGEPQIFWHPAISFFVFTRTWLHYVRVFAIANPSVVCLSFVTFVRPTQAVETFGNISSSFCYFSHPLTFVQNFTEIVTVKPLRRGVGRKRGSKIKRCHVRVYNLISHLDGYTFYGYKCPRYSIV